MKGCEKFKMDEIRLVPKDELYHYGVKGMKWGVRRASKKIVSGTRRALKTAANSGLGTMVKTDYEATKMMARTKKSAHDATTASKKAVLTAEYNRKNRKDLNMTRRETGKALKTAKKDLKTTKKDNKKDLKQTKKEIKQMRRMSYVGMTAGEKVLYRAGVNTVARMYNATGVVGRRASEAIMNNYGDRPLTALEEKLN